MKLSIGARQQTLTAPPIPSTTKSTPSTSSSSSSSSSSSLNMKNTKRKLRHSIGTCYQSSTHPISTKSSITSPRPPPSVKIGMNWKEFHGCNNWDGLLDPLDDNLRGEILRYGKFVEATYKAYEFDSSSLQYGTCKFHKQSLFKKCDLPYTGYRVTRNLHATSGIQLPSWSEKLPGWTSKKSSWIGYVAVCQDEKEIARLGRRDVVVAFRGTATCLEWLENLRATLTPISPVGLGPSESGAMVESGFLSLYTSESETRSSLQNQIREEMKKIIQMYGDEPLSITVTGHSLGAALATLAAHDITTTFDQSPPVAVVSFGCPRVGNKSFRAQVDKCGSKILRIVNTTDFVTKVPGFVVNDEEDDHFYVAGFALPKWIHKHAGEMAENTQWVYADIGRELQVCSQHSPVLPSFNPASCHELDTYLHLVNGFVSSTCPFRATASRLVSRSNDFRKEKAYAR